MKTTFAIIATALTLAACAGDAEEEITTDDTIVDENYDADADTLDEAMDEEPVIDEEATATPPPPPARQIDESDVMAEEPETDDVVGL